MSVGILAAQLPNVSSISFTRLSQQVMNTARREIPGQWEGEIGKKLEGELKARNFQKNRGEGQAGNRENQKHGVNIPVFCYLNEEKESPKDILKRRG